MKVQITSLIVLTFAFSILTFSYGCGNSSASSNGENAIAASSTDNAQIFSIEPDASATPEKAGATKSVSNDEFNGEKIEKSVAAWKKQLTAEQFYVLRQEGTEKPYSGKHIKNKESGEYHCAACNLKVFSSTAKYDSDTGWPSFYQPIAAKNVTEHVDNSLGETRTEIECARCGSHLGHVFDDGPEPTGLRYCINSVALKFEKSK